MIQRVFSTLSVRIFLILLTGILVTALLVNLLGERAFRVEASRLRSQFLFERIENVLRILDATVADKRPEIQSALANMGIRVVFDVRPPAVTPTPPTHEIAPLVRLLVPELAAQVQLVNRDACAPRRHAHRWHDTRDDHRPPPPRGQCLAVYTQLEDATPVVMYTHVGMRPPPIAPATRQPLILACVLLALVCVTWVVASVSTRPLRKLAKAARQLASNIEHAPLPENEGTIEVRRAASAFNDMQRSLLGHMRERAFMVGAIAHDLQTPLTRLRLRMEKIKEPALKQKMIDDLTATLDMVREGLDFAQLSAAHLQKQQVDLCTVAQAVCDDFAESGLTIKADLPQQPVYLQGSASLLKRCLTNILHNAITYGEQPVLSMHVQDAQIFCTVSDDGPGIPESELERILEPFRRLEDSRSRHTGGSGLGLTIARMIVEKHGGKLRLRNKQPPLHGLIIGIELPAARNE